MNFHRPSKITNSAVLLSIAALASAVSLASIFDYPELPFNAASSSSSAATTAGIASVFNSLSSAMLAAGLGGLFVLMFLESFSLPIPSEIFLPLAGYFAYEGKMSLLGALWVTTVAGLAGNVAAYCVALLLGRPLVYGLAKKLGTGREAIEKSEQWLNGKGSIAIFFSRFIPGFRSSISFPAGALRMNFVKFSIMTVTGCFGWSAILLYIGYSAGPLWQKSSSAFYNALLAAIPYAVVAASLGYVIYYVWNRIGTRKVLTKKTTMI